MGKNICFSWALSFSRISITWSSNYAPLRRLQGGLRESKKPRIFYLRAPLEAQCNHSCQIVSFEPYLIYGHISRSRSWAKENLSSKPESDLPKRTKEPENPKGPIEVISTHYAADIVSASSETLLASPEEQSRTDIRNTTLLIHHRLTTAKPQPE